MTFVYPTAPTADLAGKILLVPIVSTANVAQLAADLLIATLELQQIAILDPTYCIPVVGGREDGLHGITTPIEPTITNSRGKCHGVRMAPLFAAHILFYGKSRKQEFTDALLSFAQTSQFSAVLFLSGMDLSNRTDAQMLTPTYQLRLPQHKSSLEGTPLQNLERLPIPAYRSPPSPGSSEENTAIPFIPGGGLTRRTLNTIPSEWAIPTASLLQFVLEGDNAADAALLASVTAKVIDLNITPGEWKEPPSWKAGLFGSPHDQTLYG